MEWYYAEAGKQKGPVPNEEFERLVTAGTIQPDTLVWRAGMTNWQPYRQVQGNTTTTPPTALGGLVCAHCGRAFAPTEMARVGDSWVCNNCDASATNQMRPHGIAGFDNSPGITQEELISRDYTVDIGQYFNQAWDLFRTNAGPILGATVLVYLAMFAVNLIPYASFVLSLVLSGPLIGGLWLFYIKCAQGQNPPVGDAFGGFGPPFVHLMLVHAISTVFAIICMLPGMVLGVAAGLLKGMSDQGSGVNALSGALLVLFVVLMVVGAVAYVYIATCWFFAMPLVAHKGLSFWPAMNLSRRVVNRHWWGTFGLALAAGLLAVAGALACGVGILLTGPIAMAMVTYHYLKVFGDLQSQV